MHQLVDVVDIIGKDCLFYVIVKPPPLARLPVIHETVPGKFRGRSPRDLPGTVECITR